MLVLTRKANQAIQIGPDIRVTVTRIEGDRVKLGIEAPPDVRVVRDDANTKAEAEK
jgi:carbon storage regulator